MKIKTQANHVVFLQPVANQLTWLETKRDNHRLLVLSAGAQPLRDEETAEGAAPVSNALLENLGGALPAVAARLQLGWFTRYEVVFVAPSHRLTARFMDTPACEDDTLRDLVSFEVSEALQIPIDGIAWDYFVSSAHGADPEKHLVWIATRKTFLDQLLSAWPPDVLTPNQVTSDFWAFYEYLLGTDPYALAEPAVLVGQDGERAAITVATRRAIYLTRSVPLTRPARFDDANGMETRGLVLALEIERTLSYVADRFPPGSIQSMVVCGFDEWPLDPVQETAARNGLRLSRLRLPDVAARFETGDADLSAAHLALLCMAHGRLASEIPGPNLLQVEPAGISWGSFIPEAALPSRKFLTTAGGFLVVFLLLWAGKGMWYRQAVAERLERGVDLIKLATRLQKEEQGLRQLERIHVDYAELFLFLAETLPKEILVKSINLDAKTGVDLVLLGGNNQSAVEIQQKINESPYFKDMVVERAAFENDKPVIYMKGKLRTAG
ncbi:MAG: hypothetical protein ACE15F_17530 [bacterium]